MLINTTQMNRRSLPRLRRGGGLAGLNMIYLYNLPEGTLSDSFLDKYQRARDLGGQVDGITREPEARDLAIKEAQLAAGIDGKLRLVTRAHSMAAYEAEQLVDRYLEEIPPMLAAVRAAVLNRRDETGVHTPTPIVSATPEAPAYSPVATPEPEPVFVPDPMEAHPAAQRGAPVVVEDPPVVEIAVDPVDGTVSMVEPESSTNGPMTASLSPGLIGAGLAALGVGAYLLFSRGGKKGSKKRRR